MVPKRSSFADTFPKAAMSSSSMKTRVAAYVQDLGASKQRSVGGVQNPGPDDDATNFVSVEAEPKTLVASKGAPAWAMRLPAAATAGGDTDGDEAASPSQKTPRSKWRDSGSLSPSPTNRKRCTSATANRLVSKIVEVLLDWPVDAHFVERVAEDMLLETLPEDNVQDLRVTALENNASRSLFLRKLAIEVNDFSRVAFAWHLAGSPIAAEAIQAHGIRCDEDACMCGRYGRGGYVAMSASKANAYSDTDVAGGQRSMFLVLILPEDEVVKGERGTRPSCTAADKPSHPTEYCFVDSSRLYCICRLDYTWLPTGRRAKLVTNGGHVRAWRSSSRQRVPRSSFNECA